MSVSLFLSRSAAQSVPAAAMTNRSFERRCRARIVQVRAEA